MKVLELMSSTRSILKEKQKHRLAAASSTQNSTVKATFEMECAVNGHRARESK